MLDIIMRHGGAAVGVFVAALFVDTPPAFQHGMLAGIFVCAALEYFNRP